MKEKNNKEKKADKYIQPYQKVGPCRIYSMGRVTDPVLDTPPVCDHSNLKNSYSRHKHTFLKYYYCNTLS